MSISREHSNIANKLAIYMTKQGWASPGRKNLVSTLKALEIIDFVFDNIYEELDEKNHVHISKQMMFRKIWTNKIKRKYYIQCIEKRKAPK